MHKPTFSLHYNNVPKKIEPDIETFYVRGNSPYDTTVC